jgi:hypothetical protein
MKPIKLKYFLILILIINGCSSKESKVSNIGAKLNKVGEKIIKIDSLTSNIPQDIQVFINDNEAIFVLLNAPKNELQFYDFYSGELINKKPLDENLFGQISNFYIHNLDSIFISSITKTSIWLINSEGNILQTMKISNPTGSSLPIGNENIIYVNGKVIVSTQVAIFNSEGLENSPLVFVFDLKNQNTSNQSFEYLYYPQIYRNTYSPELGLYYNGFDGIDQKFYHGFSAYDWVYSFDIKTNKIDSIEVKPILDFSIKPSSPSDLENVNTRQYYYYSNYNYGYILIEPINRYMLRFFYSPKFGIDKNVPINFDELKPKNIIISDLESGKFKGQFILTDKQNEGLIFTFDKNIYINKIQDNEDEIIFEIFTIVE